jgi:hypothetical protein
MKQCRMCAKFWLVLGISATMLCGCQFSPNDHQAGNVNAMPAKYTVLFQQLIIKFKPHTIQCDIDGVARLSETVGIALEFVRMMSDQTCVVRQFANKEEEFSAGQSLLKQHPAVDSVELDAIRKPL